MPKIVLLWTDIVIWSMVATGILIAIGASRSPNLRKTWSQVGREPAAMAALVVMLCFVTIGLLDSVHFRRLLPPSQGVAANGAMAVTSYATRTESLLDVVLARQIQMREKTYSVPLAYLSFSKETEVVNGKTERVFPRLEHGGRHLSDPAVQWQQDVVSRAAKGSVWRGSELAPVPLNTLPCTTSRRPITSSGLLATGEYSGLKFNICAVSLVSA